MGIAEEKIRDAFRALPCVSLGEYYLITVEHNGVTQEFYACQKSWSKAGRHSPLYLKHYRVGRMLPDSPEEIIENTYKLDSKNVLSPVGMPRAVPLSEINHKPRG